MKIYIDRELTSAKRNDMQVVVRLSRRPRRDQSRELVLEARITNRSAIVIDPFNNNWLGDWGRSLPGESVELGWHSRCCNSPLWHAVKIQWTVADAFTRNRALKGTLAWELTNVLFKTRIAITRLVVNMCKRFLNKLWHLDKLFSTNGIKIH